MLKLNLGSILVSRSPVPLSRNKVSKIVAFCAKQLHTDFFKMPRHNTQVYSQPDVRFLQSVNLFPVTSIILKCLRRCTYMNQHTRIKPTHVEID